MRDGLQQRQLSILISVVVSRLWWRWCGFGTLRCLQHDRGRHSSEPLRQTGPEACGQIAAALQRAELPNRLLQCVGLLRSIQA